jgi:hypothetical protein
MGVFSCGADFVHAWPSQVQRVVACCVQMLLGAAADGEGRGEPPTGA